VAALDLLQVSLPRSFGRLALQAQACIAYTWAKLKI
jgi:hypothetical protein